MPELTLAQDGVHLAMSCDSLEAGGVFELTGRGLEAQVEQLFLGLLEEALDFRWSSRSDSSMV